MSNANTRSIYGTTYVYKENRFSPKNAESATTTGGRSNPFVKAKAVSGLVKDYPATNAVKNKFKNKYVNRRHRALSKTKHSAYKELYKALSAYGRNKSYRCLVYEVKDIDADVIVEFSKNWVENYHVLLKKSVTDWRDTALKEIKKQEHNPQSADSISSAARRTINQFKKNIDTLTHELNTLRTQLSARRRRTRASSAPEAIHPAAALSDVINEEVEVEDQIKNPTNLGVIKTTVLSAMLEDDSTKESAKMLSGFLFSDPVAYKTASKNLAGVSAETLVGAAEEQMMSALPMLEAKVMDGMLMLLKSLSIEPVGRMFLERLDFTPISHVKGELVYSLPLTPGEKITVSHKEWSHTTEEYIKEVVETIEMEQEKEISEETELTKSTSTEEEVNWKVGAAVSASYSGGGFTIAASSDLGYEKSNTEAVNQSSRHNQEVTGKAASRSKTDHRISFRVARETEVEDQQVRVIENKSEDPVRWDFYRLMRKWKIDLYHIGERLTYDLVVPEPGDYLLQRYIELKNLQQLIEAGDPFESELQLFLQEKDYSTTTALTDHAFRELADRLGITVEIELSPKPVVKTFNDKAEVYLESERDNVQWQYRSINMEFPEHYNLNGNGIKLLAPSQTAVSYGTTANDGHYSMDINTLWTQNINTMKNTNSHVFSWTWYYRIGKDWGTSIPAISLQVEAVPTPRSRDKWRNESLNKMREAARMKWVTRVEEMQNKMARLVAELTGKDSLKLRQMEKEEIMKAVLRWLLGPDFHFYPEELIHEIADPQNILPKLGYYEELTGRLLYQQNDVSSLQEKMILEYGDMIRFIQQAIEWENVCWILYPYFWTLPLRWNFKQSAEHPDFYHRSFLRAGCARVVIPIRQGFEKSWFEFVEQKELNENHPYITLASELEAMAKTSYPYTPDPNRDELVQHGLHKDTWYEYTPTGALHLERGEEPPEQ